ncbi:VIR-like protein [Mya arenaria]|uniref:VIR-like protein n=1 Tax=Mya arenaria TaxID=6604 RepID=A0ABY7EVH6_MYAAR|nr:VIR-like protein [Mya arenaria]
MVENRQEMELLFFETFSHESAEELNLDLVQFPRPVVIEEVRVIPLQTRVQADVPGGIPTDGLILKGWYNTLTIAIYGELTSVSVQTESLPPPPPPQPKKLVASVPQGSQTPGVKIEPTSSTPLSIKIEPKIEPKEWDATSQMLAQPPVVIATPHTTQHPLDYIQEQLNQANLQDYPRPGEFPRHPADTDRFSPDGHGGRERYDDGRERTDSWNYHDQDRRSRDYPTSREGSRDRDREYRGDYRDDRDRERDWDRDKRDRGSRDRDSKERYDDRGDRGRGYDERRDRDFDRGDRDRDSNRDRNFERDQRDREMNIERERGRDYDRDQGREEGYREGERERELELEPQTIRVIGRDIREAGFRDRTRDDFRDMSRDVFMETEAPRSPSIGQDQGPFHQIEEREAETFEQLSVEQVGSPVEQGYMSDGDYEAISSEDELIDIDTELGIDYEMEEEAFSYITSPFNPYQFEATSLTTFKDISQTKFEQEKASLLHPDYVRPDNWVEAMESVPSLLPKGLSYLLYVEPNPGALDYLLDWAMEGLNEARAMAQPESTYKVRHLKMGFKLAGALCCCDSNVAVKCLERGVQERLLDNFESKFMSFSLKLQIAAALHHSTRLQDGLEWFLGTHKLQGEQSGQRSLSNYQRTVMVLLQKKQVVRVIVAMTTLIKKVHLYEVMNKLALPLENQLLESLLVIVSSPTMCCMPTLFGAVRSLVQRIMGEQHGLVYLASRFDTTNKIIQALIQITDSEDVSEENVAQQLGVEMIYYLQALGLIDKLAAYHQLPGDDREDAKLRKSVSAGYSTELLNIVVHYSDSVEFLQRHSKHLLAIGEQEFSSKLARLKEWLLPLKSLTIFSHNGLPAIIEQLMVLKNDVLKLPRGLITVLRILKNLAVAPQNDFPEDKNEEMKYKYVLVELFSADCLPVFITILQKLSELMLRPWQKGVPKSSETLSLYLFIMKPCLEMAKAITQYLIMARGTEIQREIVDTIASYTQPLSQPSQEKDKISESLWTLAIRDLLKFTMKAPYTYLSGLQMLSELLPLPLPLQTKEPLTTEEVQLAINTRKVWSAHLLPLHTTLHGIVRTLATTSCQPLQQILRKICFQMSDLASPTASMITQCILDILLEHIESIGNLEKGGDRPGAQSAADKPQEPRPAPSPEDYKVVLATLGRFLNLLAYLLSQPAIKCTMLRIIGSDGEDKYQSVLPRMLDILNTVCDRPEHIQDQESIVSILQSLCDLEVTLLAGDSNVSIPEQVVNALPCVPQLTQIIEALFVHIAHPSHKYESVLPCIRALVMLTEYNYSFYILKITFEKHKSAVYRLLQRIKIKFSKDSSDTLSTFSTTLEFLRLLVCTDMPDTRSITLTNQELREVVGWNKDVTNHPLIDLQKLLDESLKEEEALDSLLESVNSLLAVLRAESPQKQKPDVSPPVVPEPLSLHTLFNTRSVYTVTDADDDRLTTTFWQTTFEADVPDLVPYDLEAICLKYCRDFNIEEELKRDTGLPSDEELTKPKKLKGIARGLAAQANRHDNFRNRPPNTSRPPSMHVDDFMKLEQKSEQNTSGPDNRDNNFIHNRGRGGFERGRGSFDRGRGGRFFTPPGSFRRDAMTGLCLVREETVGVGAGLSPGAGVHGEEGTGLVPGLKMTGLEETIWEGSAVTAILDDTRGPSQNNGHCSSLHNRTADCKWMYCAQAFKPSLPNCTSRKKENVHVMKCVKNQVKSFYVVLFNSII